MKIQTIQNYKNYSYKPAFSGGKSMNLLQTVEQIDKFSQFPPDIRENCIEVLKNSNPENKTLADIHREKYSNLKNAQTLSEVKRMYPEFNDVLSDSEVNYLSNSIINDIKNGNIDAFDKDKDISLQIIKMYWGECITVEDLRKMLNGRNILYLFNRLNIPTMGKNYGRYLKLSDKDFNEQYAQKTSIQSKEMHKKKTEENNGIHPLCHPLTNEHKLKISQGLYNHYGMNPIEQKKLLEAGLLYRPKYTGDILPESQKKAIKLFGGHLMNNIEDYLKIIIPDEKDSKTPVFLWEKNKDASTIVSDFYKYNPDEAQKLNDILNKTIDKFKDYAIMKSKNPQDKDFYKDINELISKRTDGDALKVYAEIVSKCINSSDNSDKVLILGHILNQADSQ